MKPGSVVRLSAKGWEYIEDRVRGSTYDLWAVCESAQLDTTPILCRRLADPRYAYLLYPSEIEEVEPCDTARET